MPFTHEGSELVEGGQSFAEGDTQFWHGTGEQVKEQHRYFIPLCRSASPGGTTLDLCMVQFQQDMAGM